jgi:HEAT repeat protein
VSDLDSTNSSIRWWAAFSIDIAFGRYHHQLPTNALPAVLRRLNDLDPIVIHQASDIVTVLRVPPELIFPTLLTNLSHIDPTVRLVTVKAFGSFGTNAAPLLPRIELLFGDRDYVVRSAATNAVEMITGARNRRPRWDELNTGARRQRPKWKPGGLKSHDEA